MKGGVMELIVKVLVGKLVEVLVKYAEKKFTEAKQGESKKAYVLQKVDEALDVNTEGVENLKSDLADFVDNKIEEAVNRLKK